MTKNGHLTEIRCTCGRFLGRVNGQYEIKCPRSGCHAVMMGDTERVLKENPLFKNVRIKIDGIKIRKKEIIWRIPTI